eukprot:scaffold26551_cov15-Tisochrysis_lutea.AAC.2
MRTTSSKSLQKFKGGCSVVQAKKLPEGRVMVGPKSFPACAANDALQLVDAEGKGIVHGIIAYFKLQIMASAGSVKDLCKTTILFFFCQGFFVGNFIAQRVAGTGVFFNQTRYRTQGHSSYEILQMPTTGTLADKNLQMLDNARCWGSSCCACQYRNTFFRPRLLQARQWNIPLATSMYKAMGQWRKEHQAFSLGLAKSSLDSALAELGQLRLTLNCKERPHRGITIEAISQNA